MKRHKIDYELDPDGVYNLMNELITSARYDFKRAYVQFRIAMQHAKDDYDVRQAVRMLELAKSFFNSELFAAASPMWGEEYCAYLVKELMESNGKVHRNQRKHVQPELLHKS